MIADTMIPEAYEHGGNVTGLATVAGVRARGAALRAGAISTPSTTTSLTVWAVIPII